MTMEIINNSLRKQEEELFDSDVVRETIENGQIVWLISSPEPKPQENNTSSLI